MTSSTVDQAPTAKELCSCFNPNAAPQWAESKDVGTTADYWDITRLRCAHCGVNWLRTFCEYEAFTASGRHYRMPIADKLLGSLTAEEAQAHFETANFRIKGGSYFGGVDALDIGPGPLCKSV